MVFLLELTVFYFFLTFPMASVGEFVLNANPSRINVLTTRTFSLKCNYDVPKEDRHLISLLILKATRDGTKEVVSIQENSEFLHDLSHSGNVKFSGRIIEKKKGYLFGEWTVVPKGIGGSYICQANLMDSVGKMTEKDKHVQVVEENATFSDAVAAIKELQSHAAGSLLMFADLANLAHKSHQELAKIKGSLQKSHKEFSQELAKIKSSVQKSSDVSRQALASEAAKTSKFRTNVGISYKILGDGSMDKSLSNHWKGHKYFAYVHHGQYLLIQSDAAAFCRVRGMYLAEIDDVREWEFIVRFIRNWNRKPSGYYIAGRRVSHNEFKSARTGHVLKSLKWAPGEPNNYGGQENCLELQQTAAWQVNDIACNNQPAFICELPSP